MKNCEFQIKENVLMIKVDLSQSYGPSKSGKTEIIASSEGNIKVHENGKKIMLGLNVYSK